MKKKRRICKVCHKEKDFSEFAKNKYCNFGIQHICEECMKLKRKNYRLQNREKFCERDKEYNRKNKEVLKNKKHEYYLEHQEEIKTRTKKYREENKDYYSEYNKEYRDKNKKKIQKRLDRTKEQRALQKHLKYLENIKANPNFNKEHYALNKDKYAVWNRNSHKKNRLKNNKRSNEYAKNKKQRDIGFKILCALRIRMYDVLKGRTKSDTTKNLLGCTIEDFKKHLQSQFKEGMNWKNHGRNGWHIDHIQPCCTFDLTNEDEQRKCFHYSNLRPLWAEENLRRPKQ